MSARCSHKVFSICILFSFKFFLQPLCISLVLLISHYSAQILFEMPYSAGRMFASKIAYSARNSVGRIYPSLARTLEKRIKNAFRHGSHVAELAKP